MESKFTQAFNGAKIGANEESMLLLFLSKVIFTDDKTYATTELVIFYFFFSFWNPLQWFISYSNCPLSSQPALYVSKNSTDQSQESTSKQWIKYSTMRGSSVGWKSKKTAKSAVSWWTPRKMKSNASNAVKKKTFGFASFAVTLDAGDTNPSTHRTTTIWLSIILLSRTKVKGKI